MVDGEQAYRAWETANLRFLRQFHGPGFVPSANALEAKPRHGWFAVSRRHNLVVAGLAIACAVTGYIAGGLASVQLGIGQLQGQLVGMIVAVAIAVLVALKIPTQGR